MRRLGISCEETKMRHKRAFLMVCRAGAVVLAFCSLPVARGQVSPPGQSARDNSRSGAVASRSPGNLVIAGLARTIEAANLARAGVEIIETERSTSIGDQLLADSITIIFDQLNLAIVLLENLFRAQEGQPPVIPTSIITGGNGAGGSDLGALSDQFGLTP